jgi:excisionase family DNA binding protein
LATIRKQGASPSGLLGTNEVAELLRVHPKHVYRLLKRGLPGHRVGGEWRFDSDEVLSWARDGRRSTADDAAVRQPDDIEVVPPLLAANGDVCVEILLRFVAEQSGSPVGFVQADHQSASAFVSEGRVLAAGLHGGATASEGHHVSLHLARRTVGLAYARRKLRKLTDVQGLRLASRPATAGVRRYLDGALSDANVDTEEVHGRALLCASHRDVVLALVSGQADVGLVSLAWANRAGLAFLPIFDEDYALCMKASSLTTQAGRALVRALQSPALRRLLATQPGYDTRQTGTLRV